MLKTYVLNKKQCFQETSFQENHQNLRSKILPNNSFVVLRFPPSNTGSDSPRKEICDRTTGKSKKY